MSVRRLSRSRVVTVAGLLAGAVGIAVLWASGRIVWPVYPPPGIVILIIGALLVGLTSWRWAPGVAAVMGLITLAGVGLSGGPPNLIGHKGTAVAVGNWIMIVAGCTAIIAGVLAARDPAVSRSGRSGSRVRRMWRRR